MSWRDPSAMLLWYESLMPRASTAEERIAAERASEVSSVYTAYQDICCVPAAMPISVI